MKFWKISENFGLSSKLSDIFVKTKKFAKKKKRMAGIMQPIREPSPIENYSRVPQITVSQTAGYVEDQQDEPYDSRSPSNMSKLNLSKSYAHGLSNSAETVRFFLAL